MPSPAITWVMPSLLAMARASGALTAKLKFGISHSKRMTGLKTIENRNIFLIAAIFMVERIDREAQSLAVEVELVVIMYQLLKEAVSLPFASGLGSETK